MKKNKLLKWFDKQGLSPEKLEIKLSNKGIKISCKVLREHRDKLKQGVLLNVRIKTIRLYEKITGLSESELIKSFLNE